MTQYYLIIVEGDIEPLLLGPYADEKARDESAQKYKKEHGDEDGIFWLDIPEGGYRPVVGAYSRWFITGPHPYPARFEKVPG